MSSGDRPLQEQQSDPAPLVAYAPANEYYPPYPAPYVGQQVAGMPVYQQPQVVVVQSQYRRPTFFSTVRRVRIIICLSIIVVCIIIFIVTLIANAA